MMVLRDNRDKYIKYYLNIENDLLLTFTRSCKSSDSYQHCFVGGIFIEICNLSLKTGEITHSAPLYINKEKSNLQGL